MKKTIGLLLLVLFFTCCDIGVRNSNAGKQLTHDFTTVRNVHEHVMLKDGIEYYIYYQYEGGLDVVNHTKEKLEIELLKLQIDSLKNK